MEAAGGNAMVTDGNKSRQKRMENLRKFGNRYWGTQAEDYPDIDEEIVGLDPDEDVDPDDEE